MVLAPGQLDISALNNFFVLGHAIWIANLFVSTEIW